MPWKVSQPRLSISCSQAVFLAPGTVFLHKEHNQQMFIKWMKTPFFFITKVDGTDSWIQQPVVLAHLSLNFRDSEDAGLALGKRWGKKNSGDSTDFGSPQKSSKIIFLHSKQNQNLWRVWDYSQEIHAVACTAPEQWRGQVSSRYTPGPRGLASVAIKTSISASLPDQAQDFFALTWEALT